MKILGLDEAGRGSVLGPMLVGAFLVDRDRLDELAATGVTDSKRLSKKRREALITPLSAVGEARWIAIEPAAIDAGNLNTLEERAFAELIDWARPDRVIIDAPCNPRGIPAFAARLLARLGCAPELIIEPKADLNHTPVGAASVFAKVRRDRAVAGLGAGSGYPSDPRTRDYLRGFLRRGEPLPACVRTRWATLDELRAELAQQTLV